MARSAGAMFVGREADLDGLLAVVDARETTGSRTVLIGGEAACRSPD